MLTGRLPYGARMAQARTRAAAAAARLRFGARRQSPDPGLDRRGAAQGGASRIRAALRGTVGILYDLRHPNRGSDRDPAPLIERNPLLFWKGLSALLAGLVLLLLALHFGRFR